MLSNLDLCLNSVTDTVLEDSENPCDAFLHQTVTQCQQTIHSFWMQVRRYQPHLQSTEHNSNLRESWMKVEWSVCKQEDVARFETDIQCQVVAIELALSTLQLRKQNQNERVACKTSDSTRQCVEQLASHYTLAQFEKRSTECLLGRSNAIIQQNQLLISMLEKRQDHLLRLPAQIERQKPVYLRDALDMEVPFLLEFVRSAEALLCVMRINLAHVRAGPEKLERGEFSITEKGSNRAIDLSQKWEACFFPG